MSSALPNSPSPPRSSSSPLPAVGSSVAGRYLHVITSPPASAPLSPSSSHSSNAGEPGYEIFSHPGGNAPSIASSPIATLSSLHSKSKEEEQEDRLLARLEKKMEQKMEEKMEQKFKKLEAERNKIIDNHVLFWDVIGGITAIGGGLGVTSLEISTKLGNIAVGAPWLIGCGLLIVVASEGYSLYFYNRKGPIARLIFGKNDDDKKDDNNPPDDNPPKRINDERSPRNIQFRGPFHPNIEGPVPFNSSLFHRNIPVEFINNLPFPTHILRL